MLLQRTFPLFVLLIIFVHLDIIRALSPDGQALVSFRTNIVNSDGVLLQWRPEDPDPCRWKGVTCDPKSKRVTSLSLSNHRLSGSISSDIGKLENLQFLALYDNNLYGNIPPELGSCTKLQSFYEGRCGLPSVFDATYCYALGYGAGALLHSGKIDRIDFFGLEFGCSSRGMDCWWY